MCIIFVDAHLHDIQGGLVANVGEWDGNGGVGDGMPFEELVPDVSKGGFPVDHEVENAAQGPDITGTTHLREGDYASVESYVELHQ